MRTFRHAVVQIAWLIGLQPGILFVVIGLSTFMVKADDSNSAPSSNPLSHCDTDHLKAKVLSWFRVLLITVIASGLFTLAVRGVVDSLADSEDRALKKEEEAYEAACVELNQALAARNSAATVCEHCYYQGSGYADFAKAQYEFMNASMSWKHAADKVDRLEPKTGIARLAGCKRKCLRIGFILAIGSSLGTSICACFTFYYSLQLQLLPKVVCVNGAPEVSPFAVIGFVCLLIHGFLIWIAATYN